MAGFARAARPAAPRNASPTSLSFDVFTRPHLVKQLVRLVRTCASPFDAEDVDAWRRSIAGGLNDALGGSLAQCSLAPIDGAPRMVGANIDHSVFEEYVRDWMVRDPLYEALGPRTRYTGSGLVHGVPGFREIWRGAQIYTDFFAKHRIRDTAAILHHGPPFIQLAVLTERFGDRDFLECAQPMLDVLEPVFVQSARAMLEYRRILHRFAAQIDDIETPTAIYSITGAALHRNPAFARVVRTASPEDRIETQLAALVRQARDRIGAAAEARIELLLRQGEPLHRQAGPWRLSLLIAERGLDGSPPILIISAHRTAAATSGLALLTAREREIAELVAMGTPTRLIADQLQISHHTVRRHVERVFAKLGTRSRAQLAASWARMHGPPTAH